MKYFLLIGLLFVTSGVVFAQTTLQSQSLSTSQRSRGNSFNPDMSINALLLYQNSNRGNNPLSEERNGPTVQEAELQFTADVDPYWKFISTFSLHQEVKIDTTLIPPTRSAEYVFEPEEFFAESLNFASVTVKVGKFKSAFGRHNQLHTHAYPFIDAPLANTALLGPEGLNDVGFSASALIPTSWFSEITLQALSGHGEGLDYYNGASANDSIGLLRLRNLWDLSDETSFDLGLSAASGENSVAQITRLHGADITIKWRPNRSHALAWTTEYLARERNEVTEERARGLASWLQYQTAKNWWVQVRGDYLEVKNQNSTNPTPVPQFQKKQSILIGFVPSEFSALRLQYDRLVDDAANAEQKMLLQFNYSIGAHPAHVY